MTDFDAEAAEERRSTGVLGQLNRVRQSALALLRAHIALLRAEISDIVDQLKSIAALAGVALVVALLTANLLYVGGFLFIGEWLFGSIGWGLAHGTLLGVAIIVSLALGIVGAPPVRSLFGLLLAGVIVVGIALFAGLNIGYDTAAYFAGQLASPFDHPGLVAIIGGAGVGGVALMLSVAFVGGLSGAVVGLVLGAALGAVFGWLLAGAPWTWPPAVGFAIVIGLILWPILAAVLSWRYIDIEARMGRLYPRQSIEAANETKAWLEEQWQTRRPNVGR